MKKHLFLLMLLPGLCTGIFAQIQSRIINGPIPFDALSYHLPKTVFNIQITTKIIHEEPGIYARYSERQLGVTDIISNEKTTHEIVSVELNTYTVPDLKRVFYIQALTPPMQKKRAGDINTPHLNLQLNPEGILLAVNMDATRIPYNFRNSAPLIGKESAELFSDNSSSHPLSIHTQDMQLSGSSIRMAELAAKQIFELRETRLSLLHGELENMPQDGASLEKMLTELNRMERFYTELFTGSRRESIRTQTIEYTPEKIPSYEILFRFSTQKGIVDKEDLSGYPVHFLVHNLETDVLSQQQDSTEFNRNADSNHTCGIYYYRPNRAGISILKGQEILFRDNIVVAQFGDLMELPSGDQLMVELDPMTGGIVRYKNR